MRKIHLQCILRPWQCREPFQSQEITLESLVERPQLSDASSKQEVIIEGDMCLAQCDSHRGGHSRTPVANTEGLSESKINVYEPGKLNLSYAC